MGNKIRAIQKQCYAATATVLFLFLGLVISFNTEAQQYKITYVIWSDATTTPYESGWNGKVVEASVDFVGSTYTATHQFLRGTLTKEVILPVKPTSLNFQLRTSLYNPSNNNQLCSITNNHNFATSAGCTFSATGNSPVLTACVSYTVNVKIEPISTFTSDPIANVNDNYCPGQTINLQASNSFSSYTWQYKAGTGSWTTIRTTITASTAVSDADIENNYLKNILFRVLPEGCSPPGGGEVGPFRFSPEPIKVVDYTVEPPSCHDSLDAEIKVISLSRSLIPNEVVEFSLSGVSLASSGEFDELPVYIRRRKYRSGSARNRSG